MSYDKTQKEMAPCEWVHQPNQEGLYEMILALNSRSTVNGGKVKSVGERDSRSTQTPSIFETGV